MNIKDKYVFPAIFSIEHDGVSVEFPDLPGCLTCGDSEDEALMMAKDALELHLFGLEEEGKPIPKTSSISSLKLEPSQFVALIEVWMPPIRDEMALKSVKKTLTIPKWLNDLAEEKKVNFSQVLQNALVTYLGLSNRKDNFSKNFSNVVFSNYLSNSKVATSATELVRHCRTGRLEVQKASSSLPKSRRRARTQTAKQR